MAVLKGRVRKFGDDIDTDIITPGRTLHLPMDELKTHAFEPIQPDFWKARERVTPSLPVETSDAARAENRRLRWSKSWGFASLFVSPWREFISGTASPSDSIPSCPEV